MANKKSIILFWTGGWDSTYQLLQLLIIQKKNVTPYYIIDKGRKSLAAEIVAMEKIKDAIFKDYPYTKDLLEPTLEFNRDDIPENKEITEAYNRVSGVTKLGGQYDWLARFCDDKKLSHVHMCIFDGSRIGSRVAPYIFTDKDFIENVYMDAKYASTDEFKLFKYYIFPTFHSSKSEIDKVTNEQGLKKIMDLTWFCHRPTKKLEPCGKCNPCLYTTKVGMGYRIPWHNRIRGFFKKYKRKLKGLD